MNWEKQNSNGGHANPFNRRRKNTTRIINRSQNAEDVPFNFKLSIQQTGQLDSNNSNRQEQWNKNKDSANRQEQQRVCQQNNNSNNGNANSEKQVNAVKKFYFGYRQLEELCNKDPTDMIFVMSNKTNGFMDLFKQNKGPDWLFLLMKVSAKICSTEFIQSKTTLLIELICNQFFEHLKSYILNTPTDKNPVRCINMNDFFNDCLIVFQSITVLFPKTAVERLKEIVVSSNIALTGIKSYTTNININETTMIGMNELLNKLNDIKITDELKLKEKLVVENNAQFLPPPQNFRELTVYPTATDFEFKEQFLRPNIVKGIYQNVEHYLDVQFRLLREDFIAPLREGITYYKEIISNQQQHQRRKKINNIRIYRHVEFEMKGEFVHDKNGCLINFNKNNALKINWEMAKRFMYGSLLLFSVNEFRTFFLGIVLERKIELLKEGKLIVELLEDVKPLYNTIFTMVESETFFEPYKCSMEVLKTMNDHNFPMKNYIISACTEINYPHYIDIIPDAFYSIDNLYEFHVLLDEEWPTAKQLKLDLMQYRAFKAALTHEFTIIQGPPGTGKTYIGLKIMKNLINNLFRPAKPIITKPILVVCYTNHALDQFIEGILSFTNKVVRIGGQSKSKAIEEYNLKHIVYNYRRSTIINRGLKDISDRVNNLMSEIKYFRKCRDFVSYNVGVLELSLLKNGMPKKYHNFFKSTVDLLSWLFQDHDYFDIDPIRFITVIKPELIDNIFGFENLSIKWEEEEDIDSDEDIDRKVFDLGLEHINRNIVIYSITLDDVKLACKELLAKSIEFEELPDLDLRQYNTFEETKLNFGIMERVHDYFEFMLSLASADNIQLPNQIQDLKILDMKQRWALYFIWVKTTKERFGPKIIHLEQMYTHAYKQYTELRELENIEILNTKHVIALTTTGAAKHRIMLEGLKSRIVVVEEAAEVLEAHIVTSLTRHCQHLILIGDHKQLKPSNAVYKLAKDFNFDISLFERMVNNDVPCYTLGEQHRMRPEIASLITPTIYPDLKNHISVYNRESVHGVTKDLFFLNHNVYETEVEEITSKSNEHEATFLIMLARHLLLQGYKTEQVTILTTYSGQLFKFRSLRKKYPILAGIRITVVDNYQGEESDIVLLSLVRSNEKGNVGFLKIENRICVALSRAKYGLYIMGNMYNLYNSGSLWKQIKKTLDDQDSYGDELSLECAIHSGIITKVSKSEDFNMIMEGGCTMLCKSLLPCGHYCSSICHPYDREHIELKCREPCNKSCEYNHPCMKLCFMDCGKCMVPILRDLPCGHQLSLPCFVEFVTFPCEEKVETVLVECGHTIVKPCHEKKPNCTFKCFDRLDCGHVCERNCHKNDDPNHERYNCMKACENVNKNCLLNHKCQKLCHEDCSYCSVKVDKILPCGHMKQNVPCKLNDSEIKCYLPCDRLLDCDHKCKAKCYELCKPCEKEVKKTIPDCGHSIKIACKSIPNRKHCTKKCERTLVCGHKCKNLCAKECFSSNCNEIVVLGKIGKLACGHNKIRVLCCDRDKEFEMDSEYLLDKCQEPCLKKLNCNDNCLGTCGQCKQGRLHIPCSNICNKINPCNHTCKFPCKERCPPCNEKCLYSCIHSNCARKCGEICVKCVEKCNWQCPHLKCTRKCFEICNREPCYEPCNFKLKCGHYCIGFCGEPCPPLCRICQCDEVTTILFGNEDEPDARFVYLKDCGHSIESKSLEQWMNQNTKEITMKQCPLCKTPILKTQRFMNQVKVILGDISKIKEKQLGELSVIKSHMPKMLKSFKALNNKFDSMFIGDAKEFGHIKDLWDKLCQPLLASLDFKSKKRVNFILPPKVIESLEFVVYLFKSTSEYKERIRDIKDDKMRKKIINHFVWLLSVAFKYARQLSNQQKSDINLEMVRGVRILSLFEIQSKSEFKMAMNSSLFTELANLESHMTIILMSCQTYSVNKDENVEDLIKLITQKIECVSIITDAEKKMIHEAMSVNFHGGSKAQGHWLKCSKGHIYCITECGGPMEKSFCPECKEEIGGNDHSYVREATVATEMDGSRHLAWSSANNLGNYIFN